jgi:hypothetical protein
MRSGSQAPQGLSLAEAASRFAPARLKRVIKRLNAPEPEPPAGERFEAQGDISRRARDLTRNFQELMEPIQAQAAARDASRENLLDLLKSGALVAHGFPVHLPEARHRIEVEPFLFEMHFADWNRSTFVGRGRIYEGVLISERVASPPNTIINSGAETDPQEVATATKRPVGRPNVRKLVAELALAIIGSENAPEWKQKVDLIPHIRALGIKKYPQHFDQNRPEKEVFRVGINIALEQLSAIKATRKL